jgi:hypothetical protein
VNRRLRVDRLRAAYLPIRPEFIDPQARVAHVKRGLDHHGQSSFVVGAASTNGQLAAERDATGPIRIYTLTYVAGDVAGNTSLAS